MRRTLPTLGAGMPALTVRISDACRMTGIGRSKFYELIKDGAVEVIKVGAITLVPMSSIQALLDRGHRGAVVPMRSDLADAMHPLLARAILTATLAGTPVGMRRDLCSADERSRAAADDRIVAQMVAALYSSKDVGISSDLRLEPGQ